MGCKVGKTEGDFRKFLLRTWSSGKNWRIKTRKENETTTA